MRHVLGAVLVVIGAGSAHAQPVDPGNAGDPPPTASAPGAADAPTPSIAPAPSAPPLASAPDPRPAATRPASATPSQVPADASDWLPNPAAQFLIGGVTGTAGLFAGALIGYGVECARGCNGDVVPIQGLVFGAALGLTTASAVGVTVSGSDRDHTGSFGWTWLGAAAGGTAAVIAAGRIKDSDTMAVVGWIGGAALGGTIAFDLTRTRRRPQAAVRLVPLITGSSVQLALVGAR